MVEKQPISKQIYIFQNEMYPIIKIGMSDNPKTRLKTLQTNSGFPLTLVYESEPILNPATIERLIHVELKEFRTRGEWFELDAGMAEEKIKDLLKQSIVGEYKDLTLKYANNEEPCIKTFETKFSLQNNGYGSDLTEVEDFLYESKSYNYYICYKQGKIHRTVRFCNKGLALKFKNEHLDKLIKLE